jgi:hypothetical protein
VRDTQNQVNTVLLVKMSDTDTAYKYVCDWQYHNKARDLIRIDSSAEKFSLFFMYFDHHVFGYDEFIMEDTTLFINYPKSHSEPYRKIGIRDGSGDTHGRTLNAALLCYEGYYCGTPTAGECTGPGGCDYLNCPTQQCYGWEVCFELYEEGGGGFPGDGPWINSGGGEGGGGGSGWEPPTCPGGSGRYLIINPCGGGWIPVVLEDELPILPPYIINNLTKGCLKAALYKLSSGTTNTFFKDIYNVFDSSTSLHLYLGESDLTAINAYGYADTMTVPNIGFVVTVTMDTVKLLNCSQEWKSYVMIHEVAHAGMFVNAIQWDTANSHHISMAGIFLNSMANALMTAYPSLPEFDAYAICFAGFYNGVEGSPTAAEIAFSSLVAKKITQKFGVQYNYSQLANFGRQYTEVGTKGTRVICN